jgi:cytochrome c oxidase subunit 2
MDARVVQSVLAPAGVQAAHVARLWWVMLGVTAAVYVAVLVVMGLALWRSSRVAAAEHPIDERTLTAGVAVASGATIVVLFGLLAATIATGRAMQPGDDRDALRIRITGYQWWWDVEYETPDPSMRVRTANELHLPVGRPVVLSLVATDVIHSFWAPPLAGKIDLIPGRTNTLWLQADQTGIYRAQCAEFCGLQHAHMALDITAELRETFDSWYARQRQPAASPTSGEAERGLRLVEHGSCAMCHAVLGTAADARTGPDLTHVGGRRTLAAGTLPNDPSSLSSWLIDPQAIKPGNKMPPPGLSEGDRRAVVAYLESLR